jgi:hypothetical protein
MEEKMGATIKGKEKALRYLDDYHLKYRSNDWSYSSKRGDLEKEYRRLKSLRETTRERFREKRRERVRHCEELAKEELSRRDLIEKRPSKR